MSSSSTSNRDFSESSNSPNSYTSRESPYNSPSQQVFQITNNLTELNFNNGHQPQLHIINQPQNHFRFRYVSEMVGTHGCLLGKTSGTSKTKTHPTVELLNFSGRALIRCQLAQCDVEGDHPHRLLEDDQDRDVSSYVPEHNSYVVSFAGMGIIHTAKKDVPGMLFKKFSEKFKGQSHNTKLKMECDNMAKKINLNIVRLKFSAHDIESGKEICAPVFSEPIHNMKSAATNDLKICRISRYTGRPRGGDDVFILVEKVSKKNIMVRFLEVDEYGEVVWMENGSFVQSDVHHQYAIVFRTPPYKNPQTPVDVTVFIELVRPSDGRTSERKPFTYKAEQVYKQLERKKRKNNSYSSLESSSGGSITNEIPTVLFSNPNDVKEETEGPLFTIQALPLPSGSPGHCGLGSALGTINSSMASPINAMSSPMNAMTSSPDPAPMWSGAKYATGPFNTSIPNLKLDSEELEQIISRNQDVMMTEEDHRLLTEAHFSQYVTSYTSLSDFNIEEPNPIGELIRASTGLVSDSGRVKVEPSSSKSSPTHSPASTEKKTNIVIEKPKDGSEYDALYKPEDGLEVKTLVQDLCQIIRNKKGYKNQEVREKLERLFEIRLSNGDTFLHMTLCSSQPSFESIVKVISSVNMSHLLNCTNNKQLTVLHLAVIHGTPRLISLLVAKGCNPSLKNFEDDNVVQYAVRYKSKLLEPLLEAIKKNDVSCDLNSCNSEKQTALHLAALANCAISAQLLLSHGASYNVRDAAGRTPLHLAAYDARLLVMRMLLEYIPPSDIDALDGSGNTALQIVCGRLINNHQITMEMLELLLNHKADPLKHEEHNESAWRLSRNNPEMRAFMKRYVTDTAFEDDVKSEPEDEFESADEDMPETGMQELSLFAREVSERLDASGAWLQLATRLHTDTLSNWFASQDSPSYTLLHHIKECREDISSKSLALILDDMGETEAAKIIRSYLD